MQKSSLAEFHFYYVHFKPKFSTKNVRRIYHTTWRGGYTSARWKNFLYFSAFRVWHCTNTILKRLNYCIEWREKDCLPRTSEYCCLLKSCYVGIVIIISYINSEYIFQSSLRYTRRPFLYDDKMVEIELSLTNQGDAPIEGIHMGNKVTKFRLLLNLILFFNCISFIPNSIFFYKSNHFFWCFLWPTTNDSEQFNSTLM